MSEKHDVRKGKDIEFGDDVTRTIKPLSIRQLRLFMKEFTKIKNDTDGDLTDENLTQMVKCVSIALDKVDPALAEDLELLEDILDMPTINQVISIAMGSTDPEE